MNKNKLKEKHWWCESCETSFKQEKNLKSHQKIYHDTQLRRYLCKQCQKSFTTANNLLKHHEAIHTTLPLPEKKDLTYSLTRNTRAGVYFMKSNENKILINSFLKNYSFI